MATYKELIAAKAVLELPDRASLGEIRTSYISLLKRWHPDTCTEGKEKCSEMTQRIVSAYRTVCAYCEAYEYSFDDQELRRHLSNEEWWLEKFGEDPLWSKNHK
ncbi:curved DNA-binding protein CbpA [Desulfomicrobium macestii]|uniref:Curved DNA-binding protein CbpA n=1 Tax=Desulfomicrobium macestii TaxID=90731 RepID=A0ABR9H607_9BACT|nr:J domain-containing protein [Desulfomicrobium macestii]MBE1425942.1 curved DNA-binding protein CbpA [Desulfomicrobium macestii]